MDEFEGSGSGQSRSNDTPLSHKSGKQNPIDFLTQLIGQTKKTGGTEGKPGSAFFENLSMLTKTVKTQFDDKGNVNLFGLCLYNICYKIYMHYFQSPF